jgi:hypothetical protein
MNQIIHLILVQDKGGNIVLLRKPKEMKKIDPMAFSEPGYSNNVTKLSMKKKEKLDV